MSQPRSADLIAEARKVLDPFLARLVCKPEVEGVAVLSSMAVTGDRITFDELSDIDLTVWVRCGMRADEWRPDPRATRRLLADRLPPWLSNFSFHLPLRWGMVEMNLHQRLLEYDLDPRTAWDDAMREAHAFTAEILHDRHGNVKRLIKARTMMSESEQLDRLLRLASRLEWDIRQAPERMLRRGDMAAAHYILGAAVDELIELLYVLAGRFVPHRKWRLAGLSWYGVASATEISQLKEAMQVAGFTEPEFHRRVTALEQLWRQLRHRLPSGFPAEAYRFYSANVSANRQLRPRTLADDVAERYAPSLGSGVYDLTNYLVPGGFTELAGMDENAVLALPPVWQKLAVSLREQVRRDLTRGVAAEESQRMDAPATAATGSEVIR